MKLTADETRLNPGAMATSNARETRTNSNPVEIM